MSSANKATVPERHQMMYPVHAAHSYAQYTCPVDPDHCEVVSLFATPLVQIKVALAHPEACTIEPDEPPRWFEQALDLANKHLPCYCCRLMEAQAKYFIRLRLGKQERNHCERPALRQRKRGFERQQGSCRRTPPDKGS